MGETICRSWWTQYGVPVRMARLGHTYGPGLRRTDERAFAQFVFNAIDGHDIILNSDGAAVRPYCYLADAVAGLLRVMLVGTAGEAYLVANPAASCSVLELANLVASLAPRPIAVKQSAAAPPVDYLPNRDPAHPLDVSKMRALGWNSETGLHDGFARTIESFR
jgi:nucleoside-diphosphate-sugar epimerase